MLKDASEFCMKSGGVANTLTLCTLMHAPDAPGYGWWDIIGERGEAIIDIYETYEFPTWFATTVPLISADPAIAFGTAGCVATAPLATARLCALPLVTSGAIHAESAQLITWRRYTVHVGDLHVAAELHARHMELIDTFRATPPLPRILSRLIPGTAVFQGLSFVISGFYVQNALVY